MMMNPNRRSVWNEDKRRKIWRNLTNSKQYTGAIFLLRHKTFAMKILRTTKQMKRFKKNNCISKLGYIILTESHSSNFNNRRQLYLISRFSFSCRDPMDALLLEQHLRSPLRLFPDPMMAQFIPQDADSGASAALLEKARQHLQMWGRSPYTELLLPQMYQRPNINAALNLGLWQGQWPPQLSAAAGFLNNQAALQQAAAAAAAQQHQQTRSPPPPPGPASTPTSSGSQSPDIRSKHFAPRFSPYQMPHTQTTSQSVSVTVTQPPHIPLSPQSPHLKRSPSNWS